MGKKLELVIPSDLSFSELDVSIEEDGSLGYDIETLGRLAVASGLDEEFFERQDPEMVMSIIMSWYLAHRQMGGQPCPVMEDLHDGEDLQTRYGAAYAGMSHTIQ